MPETIRRFQFSFSTTLLALCTALILFILYFVMEEKAPLIVMAAIYLGIGIIGLLFPPQSAETSATAQPTESAHPEADSKHHLPLNTVEMPATQVNGEAGAVHPIALTVEEIAVHIHETTQGLVKASYSINEVTKEQAESAQEQAEVIHSTNNLMDDFLELTGRVSEQARTVNQMAQEAAQVSRTGQGAIEQSINSMDDIRRQVEAIGDTIITLAKLTRRIDEIITSVGEIATQSNLLALNASIEAARAGVHGRGFAVVADEVRSLSQQSTNSADQIRSILGEIQKAMEATLEATRTGLENVDEGVSRTREANNIMVRLAQSVSAAHESVRDIYEIIQQQSENMEDISVSMDRIERITEQNLSSTRTVESVSGNLTRLASDLQSAVGETIKTPV